MKKIILAVLVVLAFSLVMGCTSNITVPVDASNNPIGSKVGEQSETVHFVWILPFSWSIDASAYKAAQNGGISKIATVDVRTTQEWRLSRYFPLFRDLTVTTIVTGE
jgi:hypothetical protein